MAQNLRRRVSRATFASFCRTSTGPRAPAPTSSRASRKAGGARARPRGIRRPLDEGEAGSAISRRWIDGSVTRHGLGGQSQSGPSGRLQPPPPLSSLLLDALNRDLAEAGVFTANVRLKWMQFGVECLDR